MRLKRVTIKNFRGYADEQTLDIEDDITALVGKNDAGKSSIMEALSIFFGNSSPEADDLNIDCEDDKKIYISCAFGDLPEHITVDSTADTSLKDEYMLNKDGLLEILKIFNCGATVKDPDIYIRAQHPTVKQYEDLLTLKIEDLKKRANELNVQSPDDRTSNIIRKTIWKNLTDLKLEEVLLSYNELTDKFQSVYKNLEKEFPQFFIFRVDRQTADSDSEAKDPIQVAVKEAKKQFDHEIKDLENKITESVIEVTERALEKLKEMDPDLAQKLTPEFKKRPSWTFDYKIIDQRGVPLNKRGSGTRRLVLLNFFRAEAERASSSDEANIIYAIEEPETSQHPNNQGIIIKALRDLSADKKRQVIISSHSPELIEKLPRDSVRFISVANKIPEIINGEQGLILAADSLGTISSQKFGSAKILILVEGMPDCYFIEHAFDKLFEDNITSKKFKECHALALPLGGHPNIKKWIEKNKADDLGLKYYILIDSDRVNISSGQTSNEKFCEEINSSGRKAHSTRKREIENYIDCTIAGVEFGDYDDAKLLIAQKNNISRHKVVENYWLQMNGSQIIESSKYIDSSGEEKSEIVEIIQKIISL